MSSESSNQSQPNSYLRDFLRSRKISGVVNFGQTVSIWPRLASEATGKRSNAMLQVRERQWRNLDSFVYSLRSGLETYLVGSAPR